MRKIITSLALIGVVAAWANNGNAQEVRPWAWTSMPGALECAKAFPEGVKPFVDDMNLLACGAAWLSHPAVRNAYLDCAGYGPCFRDRLLRGSNSTMTAPRAPEPMPQPFNMTCIDMGGGLTICSGM